MSASKFTGGLQKQDAKKALAQRPVLVLFYMIGCPHCEANQRAWEEAKKKAPAGVKVVEVEADATPDDEGVSGFPTMKYKDASGTETVISGEKQSGEEILKELKVSRKTGSSRRSRSLRRTRRGRDRKLRHRTLRNYISFRQKLVRPGVLPQKR